MENETASSLFVSTVSKIKGSREASYTEIAESLGITFPMLNNFRRGQQVPGKYLEKLYTAYPNHSPDPSKYERIKTVQETSAKEINLAALDARADKITAFRNELETAILEMRALRKELQEGMASKDKQIESLIKLLEAKSNS